MDYVACFHLLNTVNNAFDICVHVSVRMYVFSSLGCVCVRVCVCVCIREREQARSEIPVVHSYSVFNFLRSCQTIFKVAPFYISKSNV